MRRLDLKEMTFRRPVYNKMSGQHAISGYETNGRTYYGMPLEVKNAAEMADYGNMRNAIFKACFNSPVDIDVGDGVFMNTTNTLTPSYVVENVVSARGITLISAKLGEDTDEN